MHSRVALDRWFAQDDEGDGLRLPPTSEVSASVAIVTDESRLGRSIGDATAEAYERHAPEIHAFLLRLVRDADAAGDLTADTFTKLLIEERANRTPVQTRAWLYRVASNLAMSRGRRLQTARRSSVELERRASRQRAESPEHEFLDRERDEELHRALAQVTMEERRALLLAAAGYDGMTIAALIGKSHAATRTLMSRARRRLRGSLQLTEP